MTGDDRKAELVVHPSSSALFMVGSLVAVRPGIATSVFVVANVVAAIARTISVVRSNLPLEEYVSAGWALKVADGASAGPPANATDPTEHSWLRRVGSDLNCRITSPAGRHRSLRPPRLAKLRPVSSSLLAYRGCYGRGKALTRIVEDTGWFARRLRIRTCPTVPKELAAQWEHART